MSAHVQGFGCRPLNGPSGAFGGRKPPREETALKGRKAVPQVLSGFWVPRAN
jgi:hypothetical protein